MQRAAVAILALCLTLPSCQKTAEPEGGKSGADKKVDAGVPSPAAPTKDQSGGMTVLPSGLSFKILQEGDGPSPVLGSRVMLHVTGWLPGGEVFLDTHKDGKPREYKVDRLELISGWVEALVSMKTGEKRRLHVPSALAYGSQGYRGVVPARSDLDFEIELVSIAESR